jgi:hypothetical protein
VRKPKSKTPTESTALLLPLADHSLAVLAAFTQARPTLSRERLGFDTGRQRMALERWTIPTLSRRACSRRLESCQMDCAGVANNDGVESLLLVRFTPNQSLFAPPPAVVAREHLPQLSRDNSTADGAGFVAGVPADTGGASDRGGRWRAGDRAPDGRRRCGGQSQWQGGCAL